MTGTQLQILIAIALATFAGAALGQEPPVATVDFGWLSVTPPLLAIGAALVFRHVIPALFLGIWVGGWIFHGLDLQGLWQGLLDTTEVHVLEALADADHAAIIVFSLMIGGMVGIISRNGGMQGVVNHIAAWANDARHASIATAGMGLAVFFDDYANTLVVGNTMRPITDDFKVSREKLAYIVDSTAAPVSCLAFVTTWIGYEVGLIDDALDKLDSGLDAYAVFLASIPYSFYPILAILFVFVIAFLGKDFGAMLRAEQRARHHGVVESDSVSELQDAEQDNIDPHPNRPHRAVNAILPVATLVLGVLGGLLITGGGEGKELREIIGDADSYKALLWGSLLGVVAATILSLAQRVLNIGEVVDAWYRGARSMLLAMIILILAWSLSGVTEALNTADFLASVLGDTIPPGLLPALVFVLAAATAFSTGTSWGTMGILMPLVIPLLWAVLGGVEAHPEVFYSAIACVLAGAVWGDHCSPISDTTVLSSMASGCDHIAHVRTQLPYAVLVGLVALIVGTIPSGYGAPAWVCLVLSAALLFGFVQVAGQRPEDPIA